MTRALKKQKNKTVVVFRPETTQRGSYRPWDYQQPTLEASRTKNQGQTRVGKPKIEIFVCSTRNLKLLSGAYAEFEFHTPSTQNMYQTVES